MDPELKKALINRIAQAMSRNITLGEVTAQFQQLTPQQKDQFLSYVISSDNGLFQLMVRNITLPKATSLVDNYIASNSFPTNFVEQILKGYRA